MDTSTTKQQHTRIFGLDLLRAIAIILVVFSHGKIVLAGFRYAGFPSFRMVGGVDLFFVLSGFLIGGILLHTINKEDKFGFKELRHFWKRRWYRTLPNYYLILLANYLVVRYGLISGDITQFNYHFVLFIQNFHEPFGGFFWESWSLSVEEWFYLITPFFVLIFLRFLSPKRSYLLATLIMIVLPVFYRYSLYTPSADSHFWDITFRKIVLCRLDSIGFGLLAAWLYFYYQTIWERFKWPAFLLGFSMLFCLIYFRMEHHTFFKQVFHYTFIPLGIMLVIPLFNAIKKGYGYFGKVITHISKISYSMYLINLALVACVIKDNFPPISDADSLLKYLIYWIVVIGASSLLYKYFEKPMMDLRDR